MSGPSSAATSAAATTSQPTIFTGNNKMRIFQEEIFGPVVAVTSFTDYDDAIAHRQRHPLRAGCRRVEPRRQHRLPRRPRHQGRPGVDQLLPRLPGARGVRRLQAVRHRPREPPDDARPLPADQEPAGLLQQQGAGSSEPRTNDPVSLEPHFHDWNDEHDPDHLAPPRASDTTDDDASRSSHRIRWTCRSKTSPCQARLRRGTGQAGDHRRLPHRSPRRRRRLAGQADTAVHPRPRRLRRSRRPRRGRRRPQGR